MTFVDALAEMGTRRTLTRALLKRDFGLVLELPSNRLCPIVRIHDYLKRHSLMRYNLGYRSPAGSLAVAVVAAESSLLTGERRWKLASIIYYGFKISFLRPMIWTPQPLCWDSTLALEPRLFIPYLPLSSFLNSA